MSRNYKNIIKLKRDVVGKERRENLTKEVLQNATPLPEPLEYEDIDKEFERWVSEDLDISFEEQKLPTYLMLSNQRFSEYLQSWEHVDEKKNLILNFKAITRENNPRNPSHGNSTQRASASPVCQGCMAESERRMDLRVRLRPERP